MAIFKWMGVLLLAATLQVAAQERISLRGWRLRPVDSAVGGWIPAVVPGCVFTSYVQAGIEKDPNFGDNIYTVDRRKYDRDFEYRVEFETPRQLGEGGGPARGAERKVWLRCDGINRRGELFLNGRRLGQLDGFMDRGCFDLTGLLVSSGRNVLRVVVGWPGRPVANHASPTYISSDGWDWMPSVPGLLQGITGDMYLEVTGPVRIVDPWVRTSLGADTSVDVSLGLDNRGAVADSGVVRCTIEPGNIVMTRKVRLGAGERVDVGLRAVIRGARLWWPNGYGKPDLYSCKVEYAGSDSRVLNFGIRKFSYDTVGGVLHISVNGRRVFVRGGNWGMSEYLLRCRGAEYDWKVRLHREMNLNMIRNWIGSTTDEEFYDACDKYGIMVWDDFWLNSHPNLPDDVFAFNRNAVEKIKRLRNHACIAVWCGDNEGYPLPPLNGWLREDVRTYDGGERLYQANSHADGLTGSGPWANFHPNWYFTKYPGGFGGSPGWGFRTEIGTAVFTTYESFRKFVPDSLAWPRNELWNKHFFGSSAANAGPDRYDDAINKGYGVATGIRDYCKKAQLVNIETNKALYEGWQHHIWADASGVMTWMSQPAYPSMVWQTYDYYYDLTGAYWGVKKACEPLHIQWSYADNSVKVVNTTTVDRVGLRAEAIVYGLDGRPVPGLGKRIVVDVPSDTAVACFDLGFDKGEMHFIRLLLRDAVGRLVSDNFYWRSSKAGDYTALNKMGKARVGVSSKLLSRGGRDVIVATVKNGSSPVAFAVRVQAVRASDGERLLPALMNDNYFTLFKGEHKTIEIEFDPSLLKGGDYRLIVEPYNK
ncbi:MAG: hypothetical protein JST42_18640 [Bacteroidetes bacterium]|nr:hypothetical protein [Bacteroidota bacterium]